MSKCDSCGKNACHHGDDCSYLAEGQCNFCHCDNSDDDSEFDNDWSANIILHNLTREQAKAAPDAAVDAVEDLRQEGQPRHDGHAIVDKTERILSSKEQRRLKGIEEDDEDED